MTMDSIRKIVVCPQYLFVDIGFDKFLSLPRQAVPEPDYSVFCDYLINLYRTHAQQHQKEAVVTQSKWILELSDSEMSALSAQAASESSEGKCSFSKTVVVVLLGILFLIAGFIIIGAMADAMKLF